MRKMQTSFRVPVSVWTGRAGCFLSRELTPESRCAARWLVREAVVGVCRIPSPADAMFPILERPQLAVDHSLRAEALLPRSRPSLGRIVDPASLLTAVSSLPWSQAVPLTHSSDLPSPEAGPETWSRPGLVLGTAPHSSCLESTPTPPASLDVIASPC